MKDTEYAFAVARVRAKEPFLLHEGELQQMISAPGVDGVLHLLEDKGWDTAGAGDDPNGMLREETEKMWRLLMEIAPKKEELFFLVARNDFHNAKAALKALISGQSPKGFYLSPYTVEPEELRLAVENRAFGRLPREMEDAVKAAYDVLVETTDAQLCDIILDRAALEATVSRARAAENKTAVRLAELLCVTSNLKIALRAAGTGKTEEFLLRALCDTGELNRTALAAAAARGTEELLHYLAETPYREGAEKMEESPAAFEKWCDDLLLGVVEGARLKSFGPDPLIAYYIARDSELKTVRILLSCKKLGLSPDKIKERVRRLYV